MVDKSESIGTLVSSKVASSEEAEVVVRSEMNSTLIRLIRIAQPTNSHTNLSKECDSKV